MSKTKKTEFAVIEEEFDDPWNDLGWFSSPKGRKSPLLFDYQFDGKGTGTKVEAWHLSYSIKPNRKGGKQLDILKDVSFAVQPGEMAAILGPSGAGKSTLLDLLAGRKWEGLVSGDVLVDEKRRGWNDGLAAHAFHQTTAYVMQDSVQFAELTIRETLVYALRLRTRGLSKAEITARAERLVRLLHLEACADTQVGDQLTRGISGGQLRRLSIGVELAGAPELLLLDEPTSGLDSAGASSLVEGPLKECCSRMGKTVIATLHQPADRILHQFDKVFLLSEGLLLYAGPPSQIVPYFCSKALRYTIPKRSQALGDFIIDIASSKIIPESQEIPRSTKELHALHLKYVPTGEDRDLLRSISFDNGSEEDGYYDGNSTVYPGNGYSPLLKRESKLQKIKFSSYPSLFLTQVSVINGRAFLAMLRQREFIVAQILRNLCVGALIALIFWHQGHVTYIYDPMTGELSRGAFNMPTMIFLCNAYFIMGNMQSISQLFERKLLHSREQQSGLYSIVAMWLGNVFVNWPIIFVGHNVFYLIAYFSLGFPNDIGVFFTLWAILLLTNITAFYCAQWMAAALPSAQVTLALFPIFFLFQCNFAGYSVRLPQLAAGWKWAPPLSYTRWSFEGGMCCIFRRLDQGELFLHLWGFDGCRPTDALWIQILFALGFNALTLFALLPKKSKLKVVTRTHHRASIHQENELQTPIASVKAEREGYTSFQQVDSELGWKPQKQKKVGFCIPERFLESENGFLFSNISYSIPRQKAEKDLQILKGVSGCAQRGEVLALMGASGSGKTTLLDVLAGRKTFGNITGKMSFIGSSTEAQVDHRVAYVMQDNAHISVLSVRQTLEYAALLRMPQKSTKLQRQQRVDAALEILGLTEVQDSLVGDQKVRGISGGQMRRLTIGVEIMGSPSYLFLDEPTTGLDSAAAFEVMQTLRFLADEGRAVVTTIHQPGQEIVEMFDQILLLAQGMPVYYGPTNDALDFFAAYSDSVQRAAENQPAICQQIPATEDCPLSSESWQYFSYFTEQYESKFAVGSWESELHSMVQKARVMTTKVQALKNDLASKTNESTLLQTSTELSELAPMQVEYNEQQTLLTTLQQDIQILYNKVESAKQDRLNKFNEWYNYFRNSGFGQENMNQQPASPVQYQDNGESNMLGDGLELEDEETNLADCLLRIVDGKIGKSAVELNTLYTRSSHFQKLQKRIENCLALKMVTSEEKLQNQVSFAQTFVTSTFWQTRILFCRQLYKLLKQRNALAASVIRHLFVALFYGLLYYHLPDGEVYERTTLMFFSSLFCLTNNQQILPLIFEDRLIFYRERGAKVVSTLAYWLAVDSAYIPLSVFNTLLYCSILYPMVQFRAGTGYFLFFYFTSQLANLASLFFCQCLGATAKNLQVALTLFPLAMFFFIAFSGYVVQLPVLPVYFKVWAPALSFMRWSFQALLINELDSNSNAFPSDEEGGWVRYFKTFGFDSVSKLNAVLTLLCIAIFLRIINYICLRFISFEKR